MLSGNRRFRELLLVVVLTGTFILPLTLLQRGIAAPQLPSFSLRSEPAIITVEAGNSGSSTITVRSHGFIGPVVLDAAVSPVGPGATLDPEIVTLLTLRGTATSILTVTTSLSTPSGNYTVTVTGTSTLHLDTTHVQVSVSRPRGDFAISTEPSSVSIPAGESASTAVVLTSLNFEGEISLEASSHGNGPVPMLQPPTILLKRNETATSQLLLATSCSTVPGTYSVQVTGEAGGLPPHTTQVSVTIIDSSECSADFDIVAEPPTMTITSGDNGTGTVRIISINGFQGDLALSAAVSPQALLAFLEDDRVTLVTGGQVTVGLTVVTKGISSRAYSITIIAMGNGYSHSDTILATVVPPTTARPPEGTPRSPEIQAPAVDIPLVALFLANGALAALSIATLIHKKGKRPVPLFR